MQKTWIITGSARGLGRAIVTAVLESGDNVLATARNLAQLADLKAHYGDRLEPFALDVTDEARAGAAAAAAIAAFGQIDVLVNNAGYGHFEAFEQKSSADFRAEVETNLFGVVNMTRAVLPTMRERRSGHMLNVSSVGGRVGTPGLTAYAGNEMGDPARIAQVIRDLARRDDLPAHLVLGTDALASFDAAEAERRAAHERWLDVSRATVFGGPEGDALSALLPPG